MTVSLLRAAHGDGRDVLLRVERPPIDELEPLNADDARRGNAIVSARGRPFQRGNKAA
jgi:hypothetical protein